MKTQNNVSFLHALQTPYEKKKIVKLGTTHTDLNDKNKSENMIPQK